MPIFPCIHTAERSRAAGFTMVYLILGMLVVSALSVGVYTLTSRSGMDMARRVPHDQVILLAQSGLNYAAAVDKAVQDDEDIDDDDKASTFKAELEAKPYPMALGAGSFTLDAGEVLPSGENATVIVTSTATIGDVTFSLSTDFEYRGDSEDPSPEVDTSTFALTSPNSHLILDNQNTVDGSIHGKNVILGNQSEVTGDIIATGNVTLINHAQVGRGICASGNVDLQNHTSVAADIHSFGDVTLGANRSEVAGSIYATGNVTLLNGAQVQGDIHAGKNVTLGANNSRVHGSIYAAGNVTMRHQTRVDNDVHAGGNVELTTLGTVLGNVIAESTITLGNQSVIEGNATAGGAINHGWKTKIKGVPFENAPNPNPTPPTAPTVCPRFCMPDHAVFSPGTNNITVSPNNDRTLAPGSYGNLQLDGKNKLSLRAGDYYFAGITAGTQPSLDLDLSLGEINIFVQGNVSFGDRLEIFVNSESITQDNNLKEALKPLAAKVYLETLGSFTMSNKNQWFGTIYAKNDIEFSNRNLLVGSYHSSSGQITPGNQMEVYFVQSTYARDNWVYSCE